jgi:aspartyl-tRNA(Asn)/glutamyl-tRNA(Gln) amidotransferase subunit A
MMASNLAARVRQMPTEAQGRLGPVLQGLLDEKKFITNGVRLQADAISRSRTYDQLEQLLQSYDVILTPTLTAPPPLADPDGDQSVTINGIQATIGKWWTHLSIANLTGHPAISIPCGVDADQLPVGLHAIGGWDQEQSLVEFASSVSSFCNWTDWKPNF